MSSSAGPGHCITGDSPALHPTLANPILPSNHALALALVIALGTIIPALQHLQQEALRLLESERS